MTHGKAAAGLCLLAALVLVSPSLIPPAMVAVRNAIPRPAPSSTGPYLVQTTMRSVLEGNRNIKVGDLDQCTMLSMHNLKEGDVLLLFTAGVTPPQGWRPIGTRDGVSGWAHTLKAGETEVSLAKVTRGKCGLVELSR